MSRIILHSDDLGITSQVTKNILDAWQAGYLNGFSIIANGEAINKISSSLLASPELDATISVHINLTEGYSSAPAKNVPLLVDTNGHLRHTFGSLLFNVIFLLPTKRKEFFKQVRMECAAQIKAVRSICGGRKLASIDGHNHIHMIPGIFNEIAIEGYSGGIQKIRISDEPFYIENPYRDWLHLFWWINLLKLVLLKIFSVYARKISRQIGLISSCAIIGVLYSGRMTASRALCGISAAKKFDEIEMIFHIGRASPEEAGRWRDLTYANFHLSESREFERTELYNLANYLYNKNS